MLQHQGAPEEIFTSANSLSREGAPEILHPDLTGAPSPFEAQIARMRAAAGIEAPATSPVAAGAEDPSSPAAGGGLILKTYPVGVCSQTNFGLPRCSPPRCCEEYWAVKFCDKKAKRFLMGCCRKDCWNCEGRLRARGAKAIADRFTDHLNGRAVCYSDFTVPLHLRARYVDVERWNRLRKDLIDWMKVNLGLLWAVERTDPASKCRQGREIYCDCRKCSTWHPHFNVLWVRENGRGMLTEAERHWLHVAWGVLVGAEFGRKDGKLVPVAVWHHKFVLDPATADCRSERKKRTAQLWHLYRYMARTWPSWRKAVKAHLGIRWFGKPPRKAKKSTWWKALSEALYDCDLEDREFFQAWQDSLGECQCGCRKEYPVKEKNVCDCCGVKIRTLTIGSDESAAAEWETAGPEACWLELRRRRREKMDLRTG